MLNEFGCICVLVIYFFIKEFIYKNVFIEWYIDKYFVLNNYVDVV